MPVYAISNSAKRTAPANTARTILQAEAPASRALRCTAFSIGGYSINPAHETGRVYLVRKIVGQLGTGSTTAVVRRLDPNETAPLFTARETFTVEGTSYELLAGPFPLSPVSTLFAWQFPPGEEPTCNPSQALAVVVDFPTEQLVDATLTIRE
jgi:hypothetical protein